MPDKKITDLVDGAPLQPTDEFVVARAGDNFKIDGAEVVAAVTKHDVTLSGNTAGALAAISSGTLTLAGGNNITLSQVGNAVTISGGAAGGTFIGGISASDTLYTSGTVRFTGSQAVTVRSGTGQLVVIDAPAQTTQTQGVLSIGVSTGGNSSGQTTVNTGSRFVIVGTNGITASQGTAAGATTVTLSGITQSVQTQDVLSAGVSTGGNTAGNTTVNTGSRLVLVGAGDISLSQATAAGASTISISGAQTVQTQDVLSIGVSTGGNTSGNTTVNTGSRLVIVGSNGITASQGTAAGATTITLSGVTQTAQTQGIINAGVSTGGNSSGDTTVNTGTRLVFVGGNNVTLSQGTAANATTITISGPNVGGAQTGISGIANSQTTYTSGTVSLSELGAITIRSTTGNQFQFSVNSQTVQTQDVLSIGVSTGGNTAGNTTVNTGSRFVFSATGNATASLATAAGASTLQISVGTQTVQTQDVLSAGVSTGGNTLGNTTVNTGSRLVFVGSGMVTASQATAAGASTITLNATQSVQTNDIPRLGVSTGGNTAGDTTVNSGTRFVLVGSNMISLSQATAASATTISINATQSAQTQGIINAGVSTGGNTSGDTTVNTGTRLVFVGSNNITLSQGTAANATTITISGPSAGAFSAGMSTQGNTAGDTGFASQRIAFVGSNNITLSGSTNGGSMTISFNAPSPGAAQFSVGASNLGNTAGSTGVTGTRIVHVGSGVLSISQSTDANGATLSHLAPATSSLSGSGNIEISTNGSTISVGDRGPQMSEWRNFAGVGTAAGGVGLTWAPVNASSRSLVVVPLGINDPGRLFPGKMTVSSLYLGPWSQSDSTATMSAANTVSVSIGIYTLNGSTLSLLNSVSTSWGNVANANNSTSTVGVRWLSFHSSQWSSSPVFSNGHYWIASLFNTAGAQMTRTQSIYGGSWIATTAYSGTMGVATQNATTMGLEPFYGLYSATTTAMPTAISSNALNKQTAAAGFYPLILFNNINNSF